MVKILPYEIQFDLGSFGLMIPRLVFNSSFDYTTTKIIVIVIQMQNKLGQPRHFKD